MRVTDDVEIPEQVVEALAQGRLVIFVGAGVSIPSGLPDFARLAQRIAEDAGETISEPYDQGLGRLETEGVPVQERARAILGSMDLRPNRLHEVMVALSGPPQRLRIVTTNFDRLLTQAASSVGDPVLVYIGPALPLGSDFAGLIYLHGSVDGSHPLVLTDRNFGAAYVTEGWAPRFLVPMFQRYTVLFAGYSHRDEDMKYLQRGLPPGTMRFSFAPEDSRADWDALGITPIVYPRRDGLDPHAGLAEALEAWVRRLHATLFQREARVRELVQRPPSVDLAEQDEIASAIQDDVAVRFFARSTQDPSWLEWARPRQPFIKLFDPSANFGNPEDELARWFVNSFVVNHPEVALRTIVRSGGRLHPGLWTYIAGRVVARDSPPPADQFLRWTTVLLECAPPGGSGNWIDYLLRGCRRDDDDEAAVMIFEYLTRPHLRLQERAQFLQDDPSDPAMVDPAVVLVGDDYWLPKNWEELLRPRLPRLATALEPIVRRHIEQAHQLLWAHGDIHDGFDPLSFSRTVVDPSDQEAVYRRRGFDVLIDAAVEIVSEIQTQNVALAEALIRSYARSKAPLLRRVATHAAARQPNWSTNDGLMWMLSEGLIDDPQLHMEVYGLIRALLPEAGEEVRAALLGIAKRGPRETPGVHLDERYRTSWSTRLLEWLAASDPQWNAPLETLERLVPSGQRERAPEVADSSHQRLSDAEAVLALDPSERIEELLLLGEEDFLFGHRLQSVVEAASRNFAWSLQLTSALAAREAWDSQLWLAVLEGWRQATLTDVELQDVWVVIEQHQDVAFLRHQAADLLDKALGLSEATLLETEAAAAMLWAVCASAAPNPKDVEPPEGQRWLDRAINRPEGKIVLFWLRDLERRSREGSLTGLPERFVPWLNAAVSEPADAGRLARVVLAGQVHFMFQLDDGWATEHILPQFDWNVDAGRAQQAWSSFLVWGRVTSELHRFFVPLFEQTISHLASDLPAHRDRFTQLLGWLCLDPRTDAQELSRQFVQTAQSADRVAWAQHLAFALKDLPVDVRTREWSRWLLGYWSARIAGVPRPLTPLEAGAMTEWVPFADDHLSSVAELLEASPSAEFRDALVFQNLSEADISSDPEAVGRILLTLLTWARQPFWSCAESQSLTERLISLGADRDRLQRVCEQLLRLDCPGAESLRATLEDDPPSSGQQNS